MMEESKRPCEKKVKKGVSQRRESKEAGRGSLEMKEGLKSKCYPT